MPATIAVIGGGASGLAAAITCARLGREVVLWEKEPRVGKKLLATGNGRCNLSNRQLELRRYHGQDPAFAAPALARHDFADTCDFFAGLGVPLREEEDGKMYPRCFQAAGVLDALRLACQELGVTVQDGCPVPHLQATADGFLLEAGGNSRWVEQVILASGGPASPQLGGSESGLELLRRLGHTITPLLPAIVQLKTATTTIRGLSGLKWQGRATLEVAGAVTAQQEGEILFTDYGLSGPPILQLSSLVARVPAGQTITLLLDLLPEWSEQELWQLLYNRQQLLGQRPLEHFGAGLLPKRLGQAACKAAGCGPLSRHAASLSHRELAQICRQLKKWTLPVTGTLGLGQAQVTAGGAATAQFIPETLASRLVPGLYACGEVLDIDGDCGGFNLQWAWSSGRLAAEAAAHSLG